MNSATLCTVSAWKEGKLRVFFYFKYQPTAYQVAHLCPSSPSSPPPPPHPDFFSFSSFYLWAKMIPVYLAQILIAESVLLSGMIKHSFSSWRHGGSQLKIKRRRPQAGSPDHCFFRRQMSRFWLHQVRFGSDNVVLTRNKDFLANIPGFGPLCLQEKSDSAL